MELFTENQNRKMKLNDLDGCILDMITSVQSKHQGLITSSIIIYKECDL